MLPRLLSIWPSFVGAGQLLVVCGVLLGSLSYQFILGELPCPLCVIQRICFLLAFAGPIALLREAGGPRDTTTFQARAFALTIAASLVGAAASTRQILLHIVPPDAGYGPPVLGLHLYTWALVVFLCLIGSSAVGLLGIRDASSPLPRPFTKVITGLAVTIGIVIALSTFAMEGFHWLLPDDPAFYELFR